MVEESIERPNGGGLLRRDPGLHLNAEVWFIVYHDMPIKSINKVVKVSITGIDYLIGDGENLALSCRISPGPF